MIKYYKKQKLQTHIVDLTMHGTTLTDGTIRQVEGYNPLISEYLRSVGYGINDSITKYTNLELNLNYSGGFTDKKYIKVVAESVTSSSQSENIFIPDEDIDVYVKKSLPIRKNILQWCTDYSKRYRI